MSQGGTSFSNAVTLHMSKFCSLSEAKAFSFSLMAGAGVAIAVPLVKSFSCNSAKKEESFSCSEYQEEEDRISQLPDKVLSSIISRLPLKEAVRTSILSRRWRRVYALMPALRFPCLRTFPRGSCGPPWGDRYWDKYLKVVDDILRLYSGHKIVSFRMCLCFVTEYICDVEQWMQAIARLGIQDLHLNFGSCGSNVDLDANGNSIVVNKYSFPLQLISGAAASLEHMYLFGCSLVLTPECQFNTLRTLSLEGIILGSGEFQSILSSCLNLEKFKLLSCEVPPNLSIYSSHRLKFVRIGFCPGAREMDIRAANLVTFEISSSYVVKLFISYVPKLEGLYIYFRGKSAVPYVFCDLAKDLPYLSSLSLSISTDKVEYMDAERNIFGNLRQLDLVLRHHIEFNLLNVTPILEACPLLVKFHLGVCDLGWYRRSSMFQQIFNIMMKRLTTKEDRVERTPICHKHLEEVKLSGFVGTQNEVEVALFFLRSAVALNRMLISSTFKYSSGNGIYNFHCMHPFSEAVREMFHRELYGQAVSPTAKVIIWDGRLYTL